MATLTFHLGQQKGNRNLPIKEASEIFSDDAYRQLQQAGHLPANTHWTHVEVADKSKQTAWIATMNRWLAEAWADNGVGMEKVEKELETLQISISHSES